MNKCHLFICQPRRPAQMNLENVYYIVQIL